MYKKKSLINVSVAIVFKFVLLIGAILVKRFLIQNIGNEVNGLNSLYLSIVGFLSVAELGVGSAITFFMYKPIVEGDKSRIAALYQLFKKSYFIIGCIIFIIGVLLLPFLPYLAKDYEVLNINIYIPFMLMLLSIFLSYMFSAKSSLLNAYTDNYITTTIRSCGEILQYTLQILTLIFTKSFYAYLVCRIIAILLQWIVTEIVVRAKYNDIILFEPQEIDIVTKLEIIKNIKALFLHKIGGILVNSADSTIISAFIGVVVLGKYSNYTTIAYSIFNLLALLFSPLTSIIGHMFVNEKERVKQYYDFFYTLNFVVGIIFFLGYYAVIDNLIVILFGKGIEVIKPVSFVITVNYFIQFLRKSTLIFKDAAGLFYNDRWKPLIEGGTNIILSILFVQWFSELWGEEFGIVGVIVATIITNVFICHIVEPYVLYKYAFKESVKPHWLKTNIYIGVFILTLFLLNKSMCSVESQWLELLLNGGISLIFSGVIIGAVIIIDSNFRNYCKSNLCINLKKR